MATESKPVLGYWKIRGLAQPIRLMLKYGRLDFEDKRYEQGPAPDFSRESWMSVKFTLGLDFPNLPYYIDGDTKITESNAIIYHLGRKFNLNGDKEEEKVRVDVLMSVQMSFRNRLVGIAYNKDFNNLVGPYKENLPEHLKQLSTYLGSNDFFAGSKLTIADFCMYELLDIHKILEPACLDACPNLQQFCARFEALPAIKQYMAGSEFMKAPLNSKIASWGNTE